MSKWSRLKVWLRYHSDDLAFIAFLFLVAAIFIAYGRAM